MRVFFMVFIRKVFLPAFSMPFSKRRHYLSFPLFRIFTFKIPTPFKCCMLLKFIQKKLHIILFIGDETNMAFVVNKDQVERVYLKKT
jgi:hypothetical protein